MTEMKESVREDSLAKLAEEKRKTASKKRRRKRIIKWIVWSIVILAVLAAGTYGVYNLFFVEEVIPDQTTMSYRGPFASAISGYGQVKANKTESITVKARGELLELFVQEGGTVMEGDPLFRVDDSLVRDQITTVQEDIAAINESLSDIYEKINNLKVYAPFSGKLMDVKLAKGDMVSEGSALATLVDDSKMRLKLYFSYGYENDIKVGQSAQVSIPSSMSVLSGKVEKIEKVRRVTEEGTILFAVEIVLSNPGALTEGMNATATLTSPTGISVTPSEAGALAYYRSETITAGASGKVIEINMLDYNDCKSGALLCAMEGESYNNQIDSINNQIALKQEELDGLNSQLDAFNAVATMSGTVMGIGAQPGKMLEAGESVLSISDTSSMTVEIDVDERNIYNLAVGMSAELRQDTMEGATFFYGTVRSVSMEGKYDYGYATYPAIISVEGGEGLYSGSSIYYNIVVSSKDDCVLLPIQAVKYTEDGTCVFVKAEEAPEGATELAEGVVPAGYYAVPVVTGVGDTSVIEIIEGIADGVEVFLQPGVVDPNPGMYY